jgi:hypothetical protein
MGHPISKSLNSYKILSAAEKEHVLHGKNPHTELLPAKKQVVFSRVYITQKVLCPASILVVRLYPNAWAILAASEIRVSSICMQDRFSANIVYCVVSFIFQMVLISWGYHRRDRLKDVSGL